MVTELASEDVCDVTLCLPTQDLATPFLVNDILEPPQAQYPAARLVTGWTMIQLTEQLLKSRKKGVSI